jgi:hypothetical protein
LQQKSRRIIGAAAASAVILVGVLCGFAFQADPEPGWLVLGWPAVAFLQAVEKVQDGDPVIRVLIQIPVWGTAALFLYAYALAPRRTTMVVALVTLTAGFLTGSLLAFLAHAVSGWDFM